MQGVYQSQPPAVDVPPAPPSLPGHVHGAGCPVSASGSSGSSTSRTHAQDFAHSRSADTGSHS
ncbi:hypothetical protein DPMN_036820 [Dreissena polymorpha]|uniref:Uncharacterized protein n=1 Tax=Dreissena polymorpha TaxID=45954 RepID=A0A9D4MDQ3_DREPO|nr:hypothetical protein DPMN_036820 [Dreissena polymorpha]